MEIIKVRRLENEDLSSRMQWYNHPSTYDQVLFDIPFSLSATQEWYRKNVLNDSRKDFSFNLCISSDSLILIAFGGLVNIDYKNRKAEKYFLLDPEMTGKSIGYNLLI